MAKRRPQINFQVDSSMKTLYEEAHAGGLWVTRLCAAGLLLMIEDPTLRQQAVARLREWEAQYEDADPLRIRAFVRGAEAAMKGAARGKRPVPKAPRRRKRGGSAGSE
jgi:hypothetical protein